MVEEWAVRAGVTAVGAVVMYLLTWLPRSLWRPAEPDPTRAADRFMRRAATLVAAAVLVCGLIAVIGAALAVPSAAVVLIAVCVLLPVALVVAEVFSFSSGVVRGSVLRPRRIRELVPLPLLVAACFAVLAVLVLSAIVWYLAVQEPGSPRANHWGLACRTPAGENWPQGFSTTPLLRSGGWSAAMATAILPGLFGSVVVMAHCHRRPSLVADPAADAGLRRCIATRSVSITAAIAAFALVGVADLLHGAASRFGRGGQQAAVEGAMRAPQPPPGIAGCVVSEQLTQAWSMARGVGGVLSGVALVILVMSIACYAYPGQASGRIRTAQPAVVG